MDRTDIAWFYGKDPIADWKAVLGDDLPYHFGHFYLASDDLQTAQQQTIRLFYPDIAPHSSILDLGCGWGHAAQMLERERHCRVTCVSNTPEQIDFLQGVQGRSNAVLHDLEDGFDMPGSWDVGLLMESFEHIKNKQKLLVDLHSRVSRLVIRTSATRLAAVEQDLAFGGTMHMVTAETLTGLLKNAGWNVEYIYDSRPHSWPSLLHWKANIERHFGANIPEGNMRTLYGLCELGIRKKDWWIWTSPLLNVLATKA